ncbi:hypothetical protein KA005_61090 [bacterium]|nr:hypothetical protein [bacterium]
MNYNLYCANHNDYALHSVIDDEEKKIQTITCLSCGFIQERIIISKHVSVSKAHYEAYQEAQKHGG